MEIPVNEMKRRKSQTREDEPMIGNPADEISQIEKRRILAEDRKARSTYFQHALTDPDLELGGRFKKLTPSTVTGSSSMSAVPQQPANSPWKCDPVPAEMPLGYSVNDQEPVGELHERTGDAAEGSSTTDVVEDAAAAVEPSHVVSAAAVKPRWRRI
jgi:hypothetical protein